VNDRLSDDSQLDASDITVSVKDGEATLSGTVQSKFAKRRAEDCADAVSGVRHVQNNLRVATGSDRTGDSNLSKGLSGSAVPSSAGTGGKGSTTA
jgi:hypothetical protein